MWVRKIIGICKKVKAVDSNNKTPYVVNSSKGYEIPVIELSKIGGDLFGE